MSSRYLGALAVLLFAAAAAAAPVFADTLSAEDEKQVLTIEDYAKWRRLSSPTISPDGTWVGYGVAAYQKDATLHLKQLDGEKTHEIERGGRPTFSDDGHWAVVTIAAPRKSGGSDSKPQPTELLELATGEKVTWKDVASARFSDDGRVLVLQKRRADSKAKHRGADLILRHLEDGYDELLGSVGQFSFNKPGTHLAYTVDALHGDGNGLFVLDVATGERTPLHTCKDRYTRLTWNEEGTALAALVGKEVKDHEHDAHRLVVVTGVGADATVRVEYDPEQVFDFPKEHVISDLAGLSFDAGTTRVFFGIKAQEKKPTKKKDGGKKGGDDKKDDAAPEANPANVDIWHWQDESIQSVQQIRANRERRRTDRAVFDLGTHRFRRLTDDAMRFLEVSRDGRWGIGFDGTPYISDWKERRSDVYRVDIDTGERTKILTEQGRTLGFSPDSKHYLYWRDGHIHLYRPAENDHRNLTENAPVSFVNEEFDRYGTKPAYGVAGWEKPGADGDASAAVILRHRYDLYRQPLDGTTATNLTKVGTPEEIRFRVVRTDREERFLDLSKPLLLSAYGQWTKKSGYYRHENGETKPLIFEDKRFGRLTKAEHADRAIYSIESFRDFPDVYWSDLSFSFPKKLSDANPQQSEYRWGHRILFDYTNRDGVRLQGTLGIPDGHEPGQRLPMMVTFYEKVSQGLHRYPFPRYSSGPQLAGYVSDGWLVMEPDIHFRTRTSHSDMHECIEAAVAKCIEMGYADPKSIVLHGHSYSGQGAAYIATQTQTFAAITAGAAATNLISDFNQLWKSAGTSQHGYDIHGQGRFATNPYDDLELYLNQSAIHHVRNMNTPLLLLHGTEDGAVEWLQAVEFYNALRFNDKPVILLSYPGEGHGLRKFENQIDFQRRMRQFFDHHARGKEAPAWMKKGRTFIEKERLLKAK